MNPNTLEYMTHRKIQFQIGRVKWLMKEDGLTLEEAIAEARKSSTFSDLVWNNIRAKIQNEGNEDVQSW